MALSSTKTKPVKSKQPTTSKRTIAPKTTSLPKKTTSPKSGALNTVKKPSLKKTPAKKTPTKGKKAIGAGQKDLDGSVFRGVGRPPINNPNDVDAVVDRIVEYFQELAATGMKMTFCGLALALGYSSRTSLWENANAGNPISEPIKIAMLTIEAFYEGRLTSAACTGAIFALKNRGWEDTRKVETEKPEAVHVYLPENNRGRS